MVMLAKEQPKKSRKSRCGKCADCRRVKCGVCEGCTNRNAGRPCIKKQCAFKRNKKKGVGSGSQVCFDDSACMAPLSSLFAEPLPLPFPFAMPLLTDSTFNISNCHLSDVSKVSDATKSMGLSDRGYDAGPIVLLSANPSIGPAKIPLPDGDTFSHIFPTAVAIEPVDPELQTEYSHASLTSLHSCTTTAPILAHIDVACQTDQTISSDGVTSRAIAPTDHPTEDPKRTDAYLVPSASEAVALTDPTEDSIDVPPRTDAYLVPSASEAVALTDPIEDSIAVPPRTDAYLVPPASEAVAVIGNWSEDSIDVPPRTDAPPSKEVKALIGLDAMARTRLFHALSLEMGHCYEASIFANPDLAYHLTPEVQRERKADVVAFIMRRMDPSISISIGKHTNIFIIDETVEHRRDDSIRSGRIALPRQFRYIPLHVNFVKCHYTMAEYKEFVGQAASLLHLNFKTPKAYFMDLITNAHISTAIALDLDASISGKLTVISACVTASVMLDVQPTGPFVTSLLYVTTNENYRGYGCTSEIMKQLMHLVDQTPGSSLSIQSVYDAVVFWKKFASFTRRAINMVYELHLFDSVTFELHDNTVEFIYPE